MLNIGLAANVVKTALDKVFFTEFDYAAAAGLCVATDPLAFRQESTDRNAVVMEQFQGTGYFGTRLENQDVPEGTSRVGNQTTSTVLNYSKGVDISKNFFDDDQHSVVQRMITEMGSVARKTRDRNAMNVYNLGFTTETTNDAVALFSNSHTTLGGQTVDNLETGTLTEANLETAVVSLRGQRTQDGTLGMHEPVLLLVPNALHKDAMEITKSTLRSGTANNDLNYYSEHYPGLQVKYSPFLDETANSGSTTAWFLLSRNHGVYRFERQAIQTVLVPWQNQRNNAYIYKAEYREVVDAVVWEGSVGSNGTV